MCKKKVSNQITRNPLEAWRLVNKHSNQNPELTNISISWSDENTVDEDSVDGPSIKRKCETHTQEVPLKHDGK